MKLSIKRPVAIGLGFFCLALLLIGLTSFALGLDRGGDGAKEEQRASARSKRNSSFVVDLFQSNCARCHGADGRGDTPLGHTYQTPDFADGEWWRKHSNITGTNSLSSIVTRGKGGMPAFGKKLKPREIKSLVNYVRRFRKST